MRHTESGRNEQKSGPKVSGHDTCPDLYHGIYYVLIRTQTLFGSGTSTVLQQPAPVSHVWPLCARFSHYPH